MKHLLITCKILSITIFLFFIASCQKDLPATSDTPALAGAKEVTNQEMQSDRVVSTTMCFAAIAVLPATCNDGQDILFGGKIEMRVNTTVSGDGTTHITRHFTAKDMTGRTIPKGRTVSYQGTLGLNCTDRTVTPALDPSAPYKTYTVVGGAEMFSIHYGPGGLPTPASASVFIHQGTLVFVNDADPNDRIVARHSIISTPGGQSINQWECVGQ